MQLQQSSYLNLVFLPLAVVEGLLSSKEEKGFTHQSHTLSKAKYAFGQHRAKGAFNSAVSKRNP